MCRLAASWELRNSRGAVTAVRLPLAFRVIQFKAQLLSYDHRIVGWANGPP
jgi:hypothetical protein